MSGGSPALPGDEALEQHLHARRVHLRDPQAVADRRVGRRAPPLAQDAAGAGKADDVVHGEEVGLVAELGDQRQLIIEHLPDLLRHPVGPALRSPHQGQAPQMAAGRFTLRHQLVGILVAQLVEGEAAGASDLQGGREQVIRIEALKLAPASQVPLPVLLQGIPRLIHADPEPDGGEGIEQGLSPGKMHQNPAGRHQG